MSDDMTNKAPRGELVHLPSRQALTLPKEVYLDPRVRWTLDHEERLVLIGEVYGDVDPRLIAAAAGGGQVMQPGGPTSKIWHSEVVEWCLTIRLLPAPVGARPPARSRDRLQAHVFSYSGGADEISARNDKAECDRRSRVERDALDEGFRPMMTLTSGNSSAGPFTQHDIYVLDLDLLAAAHVKRHLERRADQITAERRTIEALR